MAATAAASALVTAACASAAPISEEHAALINVCMAYDDLRGQPGVKLGSEPAVREVHEVADAACDQIAVYPREGR